ncbi:hypothetical protein LIER_07687 [Lithospermum erythrorhizon]|uniref:BTB domain-containing protein n=1 Tax=Lithospermum erythrorhizon TaxID=34254 RepID=A0AAV3PDQ1_LITER
MQSDYAASTCPNLETDSDFGFAFNDSNFSDRVLRIEVVHDDDDKGEEDATCNSLANWARYRKRIKKENAPDEVMQLEEEILSSHMPDTEDCATCESQYEDTVAMVEEIPSSSGTTPDRLDEDAMQDSEFCNMDCGIQVKTIHISSAILAAKSPFFYKLFSNGMRESEERHVTLRIQASEEAALMDLLNFMYSNTLPTATPSSLLDVLMAADKFQVASCMRYCCLLLRGLPMTCESALLYLDLPSSVIMADAVQPLTDAAKRFLAVRYKDITKFQEEVLNLPLSGIEALLSSDDLQVASEDVVYDFILRWSRMHYPRIEERREILTSRLACLIRFPYMTCRKLKKILMCNDIDPAYASKVVLDALFFKAETPHRQRFLASEEAHTGYSCFVERAYKYRPVKVLEFELPRSQCVVYLDLKKEECDHLFPSGRVYSQAFHLGGQGFFLSAHCNMDQQSSFHCFGLFLGMQEKGSISFTVDYEFSARSKSTEEFVSKYKGHYTFTGGKAVGYRNLFGVPWSQFIAEDSLYFINGVLHLKAELTIKL